MDEARGLIFWSVLIPFVEHLGSIWGPFGVRFWVRFGSMLRSHRDSGLRPPRDQIFGPLGASLGPHVGLMLAPCWQLLGVLGHLGGFLERF